jgi:hypothetical protein
MSDAQANGIRAALTRVQIDNTREKERVAQLEANIKAMEVDLLAEAKALAEIKAKMNAELDFQKLIGREGFLGAIFDEVLWEISEETNRLLAQFPNTAHVTLYFRSENVTGKGTIQKKILPVVSASAASRRLSPVAEWRHGDGRGAGRGPGSGPGRQSPDRRGARLADPRRELHGPGARGGRGQHGDPPGLR